MKYEYKQYLRILLAKINRFDTELEISPKRRSELNLIIGYVEGGIEILSFDSKKK